MQALISMHLAVRALERVAESRKFEMNSNFESLKVDWFQPDESILNKREKREG